MAIRMPRIERYIMKPHQKSKMLLETIDGGADIISLSQMQMYTHRDKGVPSSANWKPTNPLTRRHQHVALEKPHCTATKYGYTTDASGTTPESRMSEMTVRAM